MIIREVDNLRATLAMYDPSQRTYIDTETTSFDDEQEAFKPYHGHRMTLWIMKQKGRDIVTVPLRHRDDVKATVDDLDGCKEVIADWCKDVKILANANVKFDMHFMGVDGIEFPNASIEDTLVLARLVYNEHMSYSLANLCKFYEVQAKADDFIKEWKKTATTKDYGRIPMHILVPYGEGDVISNEELHEHLLRLLPEESYPCWEIEKAVTPVLFEAERTGIMIDKNFILKQKVKLLSGMLDKAKKIQELSGIGNPSSSAQIGAYFEGNNIFSNKLTRPTEKNPKGNPSWDKDVLDWVASLGTSTPNKVADLLYDFGTEELAEATFCTGWLKHVDPTNHIHSNVKQSGTCSGRTSSEQPNTQNVPKWLWEGILIPKGHVGIAWDLSQIEYRLFAHYANDPSVIEKYQLNPKTDYHQILADKLGIPRNPTKRINFGILYGMGKGKTTTTLRREIIENDAQELRAHLYATYYDPFAEVPPITEAIPQLVLVTMAENILKEYHVQNPKIKQMQAQIKQLLGQRGYVKGYFGRRAYLGMDRAYVGLNRVIQGTAADLFKQKMGQLFSSENKRLHRGQLALQVHDAVYAHVPLETANIYKEIAHRIVTDCPFRVPVLMDFELALYNWKNKIKINYETDILSEVGKLCFSK
jgi:DNA polymerase I-like protein with 3'-5' exonuclease and polymerase domains